MFMIIGVFQFLHPYGPTMKNEKNSFGLIAKDLIFYFKVTEKLLQFFTLNYKKKCINYFYLQRQMKIFLCLCFDFDRNHKKEKAKLNIKMYRQVQQNSGNRRIVQ